ncbi:MAG: TonB-dependent receptor plug domain-containing protein [Vicinamibacterales bacterium]
MQTRLTTVLAAVLPLAFACLAADPAAAQAPATGSGTQQQDDSKESPALPASVFRLGEIVNVGATVIGAPGVGGSTLTREQTWTFERPSLDQAVNMVPGVSSTLDSNGRRNESDIFVRGFGRWQVPLMVDGVRIYLPADNRLDFARFLTADIAAVQIQKGYASVLDGPGAMGGAINLVTSRPTRAFQAEGGISEWRTQRLRTSTATRCSGRDSRGTTCTRRGLLQSRFLDALGSTRRQPTPCSRQATVSDPTRTTGA